jgi:hypothetical protein
MKVFEKVIIIINLITNIYTWEAACTSSGYCAILINSINSTIIIGPGYLPLIPEKNILPIKSSNTSYIISNTSVVTNYEFKNPLLKGSTKYECAGGFNECPSSCCKNGVCTDPSNVCQNDSNFMRFLVLMILIFFILLLIFYWVSFWFLGKWYHANPKMARKDNIYIKANIFKPNIASNSVTNYEKQTPPVQEKEFSNENKVNNPQVNYNQGIINDQNIRYTNMYESERRLNGNAQLVDPQSNIKNIAFDNKINKQISTTNEFGV